MKNRKNILNIVALILCTLSIAAFISCSDGGKGAAKTVEDVPTPEAPTPGGGFPPPTGDPVPVGPDCTQNTAPTFTAGDEIVGEDVSINLYRIDEINVLQLKVEDENPAGLEVVLSGTEGIFDGKEPDSPMGDIVLNKVSDTDYELIANLNEIPDWLHKEVMLSATDECSVQTDVNIILYNREKIREMVLARSGELTEIFRSGMPLRDGWQIKEGAYSGTVISTDKLDPETSCNLCKMFAKLHPEKEMSCSNVCLTKEAAPADTAEDSGKVITSRGSFLDALDGATVIVPHSGLKRP